MVYMTTSINSRKIFLSSLLLLALAIIPLIISTYSYVFEEKIYSKLLVDNITLELPSNLPYQLKFIVDVENPLIDVVVKDSKELIIYHQKLKSTQNIFFTPL